MKQAAGMVVLLAAACLAMAGCGAKAEVRTSHPPLGHMRWSTERTAYDFSRGRVIEVVIEGRWPRAGGAEDFEYIHLTMPDTAGRHEVGSAGVRAERLVRIGREEFLYRATGGTVSYRFAVLGGDHVSVSFDLKMELVYPKELAGSSWPLSGTAKSPEDMAVAQGLVNRYSPAVERLRVELAREAGPAAP